jgi:hypothetical protein
MALLYFGRHCPSHPPCHYAAHISVTHCILNIPKNSRTRKMYSSTGKDEVKRRAPSPDRQCHQMPGHNLRAVELQTRLLHHRLLPPDSENGSRRDTLALCRRYRRSQLHHPRPWIPSDLPLLQHGCCCSQLAPRHRSSRGLLALRRGPRRNRSCLHLHHVPRRSYLVPRHRSSRGLLGLRHGSRRIHLARDNSWRVRQQHWRTHAVAALEPRAAAALEALAVGGWTRRAAGSWARRGAGSWARRATVSSVRRAAGVWRAGARQLVGRGGSWLGAARGWGERGSVRERKTAQESEGAPAERRKRDTEQVRESQKIKQ